MKIKIIILSLFILGSLFYFNNVNAALITSQNGCDATTTFSSTTGQKCGTTIVPMPPIPANDCSTTDVFSVTTGQKCPPKITPMPPVFWDGGCTAVNALSTVSGKKCVTLGSSTDISPVPMPPVPSNGENPVPMPPISYECNTNTTPWIKVVSPNGGEAYKDGENVLINWKSCNLKSTDKIRIDLLIAPFPPTGTTGISLTQTINDGSELVTLPTLGSWSEMVYGNKFKVYIWQENYSGKYAPRDLSDNLFSINKTGTIDSPDGCTLTTGFSSIDGKPCVSNDINPPILPSLPPIYSDGCSLYTKFSSTTGTACAPMESTDDIHQGPMPPVFWDGGCTAVNTLSTLSGKKCVTR